MCQKMRGRWSAAALAAVFALVLSYLIPAASSLGGYGDEIDCGVHLKQESPATVKVALPRLSVQALGKFYECTSEFITGRSMYVDVQVLELRMPTTSYDRRRRNCTGGSLKIFDGTASPGVWAPTELCGVYERGIGIRRITSFNSAKLVFNVANFTNTTAFLAKVKFVNVDTHAEYHYGNYFDVEGRERLTGRRICDWKIPVNLCLKSCDITTPGFPGIYPPHASCVYRLINYDNGRVHLQLGGPQFTGKFNMRKSEDCAHDNVTVYDGDGIYHTPVGIYCGNDGVEVISSGNALTVEFLSGAGGPPWDYTGFDGRVFSRTVETLQPSRIKDRAACNRDINSAMDPRKGTFYTPDYYLSQRTTECVFAFSMKDGDTVDLEIIVSQLTGHCAERLVVQDGRMMDERLLCNDPELLSGGKLRLLYNSTGPLLTVRYMKTERQTFNANPISIRYAFVRAIAPATRPPAPLRLQRNATTLAPQPAPPPAVAAASGGGHADATLPIVSASTLFVLALLAAFCCHRFGGSGVSG